MSPPSVRIACDSLVALGNSTADGNVWFAKNSDRPALECQPLFQQPHAQHETGSSLRCTYIEIPQVAETARLIGSRPYWCWGFEHGLNEYGVAIGNHTVFTKDGLEGRGLIGMDLVRLGLERGRSAEQAVEVITSLLTRYGQGGSGYADKEWPYHNSFLIADRERGFVLETSDRLWAVRHVDDVASVSNHLSIGSDWDGLAEGAIEHAIDAGWWDENNDGRFDFAAAYRDTSMAPEVVSSGRHRRTCDLLESGKGKITQASLRAALRDHYGRVQPSQGLTPTEAEYFSVCMHAEPVGTTTASVIARLPRDAAEPLLYWASLGSPCVGAFTPLFVDCDVPGILARSSEHPDDQSPWWRFKNLLTSIETDWQGKVGVARGRFDEFETETAAIMESQRILSASRAVRAAFVRERVDALLKTLDELSLNLG